MKQRRKRPRPHIGDSVKMMVAARQLAALGMSSLWIDRRLSEGVRDYLDRMLMSLADRLDCSPADLQLDHEPALILRPYNPRTRKYKPDANDIDALVYRDKHSHHIKTNVRGDGAHRSDTSERVYRRKVEKNKAKRAAGPQVKTKKLTRPIPSRPFPAVSRPMRPR